MEEKQRRKKEKNLGKWGIVDGSLMREVLDNYLLNPDFSEKVLEIQRLRSITQRPRIRAFIGQGIKMKDYPTWNLTQMDSLRRLRDTVKNMRGGADDIPDFTNSVSALCIWEDGPRITPLLREDNVGEVGFLTEPIYQDIFGESILLESEKKDLKPKEVNLELSLWLHINNKGKYLLPLLKTPIEPKFRIRAMNLSTWRDITADYIKHGCVCPDYVEKDDIPLSQIEL